MKSFTYQLVQMVAVSLALFIRKVAQQLTRFYRTYSASRGPSAIAELLVKIT